SLHDQSQITPRAQRDLVSGHPVPQKLRVLLLQTQTVILFIAIPFLQLNHQIDGLSAFYASHTEQCLDIDNPDTPQFDKMAGDVRSGSYQSLIAHFSDFHHIVAHQTMASFYQFQRSLALTDAAFPHDQNAFAIYVYQNPVNGNTRRQLYVHPPDDLSHEIGRSSF